MKRNKLILFVVIFFLVLFLVLWASKQVVLSERNSIVFQIEKLCDDTPQEIDRCHSQRGFSIIKPIGWYTNVTNDLLLDEVFENFFGLLSTNGRRPHSIQISRIKFSGNEVEAIADDTLHWGNSKKESIEFQGRDAYLISEKPHESARSAYGIDYETRFCLVFLREGFVYFIKINLIGEYDNLPQGFWKYLSTFEHKKVQL